MPELTREIIFDCKSCGVENKVKITQETEEAPRYHCQRCLADWIGRPDKDGNYAEPKRCARCNSPYWNKPRR